MKYNITEREILALISADGIGQINIPDGSACEIDAFLNNLIDLENMGFVSRKIGTAFYRPFRLTEKGRLLKAKLLESEVIHA
jgi:hypothetical protein